MGGSRQRLGLAVALVVVACVVGATTVGASVVGDATPGAGTPDSDVSTPVDRLERTQYPRWSTDVPFEVAASALTNGSADESATDEAGTDSVPPVDPSDAEVTVTFGEEGLGRERYRSDGTVYIWASVTNTSRSPRGPVSGVELTINVTRPDDTVDTFTRTTDAEGTAVVAYDLSGTERGVYDVDVDAHALGVGARGTSFSSTRETTIVPSQGPVQRGVPVRVSARVTSNGTGIAGVTKSVSIERPDGSTVETSLTTDQWGIGSVRFTPSELGDYRVSVGETYNAETYTAYPAVGKVRFRESGWVTASPGEHVPITGQIHSGNSAYANRPVSIKVFEGYGDPGHWVNTTTGPFGFVAESWQVPSDASDGTYYEIQLYDGQGREIGHPRPTLSVDRLTEAHAQATGPSVTGRLGDSQSEVFEPGGTAHGWVQVTDGGRPVANEDVTLQLRFEDVPFRTVTLTTNASGYATFEESIPETAPDGVGVQAFATATVGGATASWDSFDLDLQRLSVTDAWAGGEAGSRGQYLLEATDPGTGDPVDGVPVVLGAVRQEFHRTTFWTGGATTNESGVTDLAVDVPADVRDYEATFEPMAPYLDPWGRYVEIEKPHDATVEGLEETWAAGEHVSMNYTVAPGSDPVSAVALVSSYDEPPGPTLYAGRVRPGAPVRFDVPEYTPSGTTYEVNLWVSTKSGDRVWRSISVTVQGSTAHDVTTNGPVSVGETSATLEGTVDALGGSDFANVTVVYWRGDGTDPRETHLANVSATGAVTGTVGGLDAGATYHYEVVAENGAGTAVSGARQTFTTDESASLSPDWTHQQASRYQYAAPAAANGTVYVAGLDRGVEAIDNETGAVAWRFERSGSLVDSSPAVGSDTVYVGSGSGSLYAIDRSDGTKRWGAGGDSAVVSSPTLAESGAATGTLYVGDNGGDVRAVDAATGAGEWNRSVGGAVYSQPAVDDGAVVVTTAGGRVVALDAETGDQEWARSLPERFGHRSPVVAGDRVVVAGDVTYGLNLSTGETEWSKSYGVTEGVSPVAEGGTVYLGTTDGQVRALDAATGASRWSTDVGTTVEASVAVAGDDVYVGTAGGTVATLRASDGKELASASVNGRITGGLTVANGTVYAATWAGGLHAIDATG